jgi:hypothetical protein
MKLTKQLEKKGIHLYQKYQEKLCEYLSDLQNYDTGDEYYEKDLTKSYIKLVKDIFDLKYGEINREVIECFGDTIKTSKTQFKTSYKTTIKEIIKDKIYIHTSLNKSAIRKMVNLLGRTLDFNVTHRYSKSEKLLHTYEDAFFLGSGKKPHDTKLIQSFIESTIKKEENNDLPFKK